jgi:hypothetical protein
MRFQNIFRPSPGIKDANGNFASHYCAECDSSENIIKSNDPSTGFFFVISGHKWLPDSLYRDPEDPKMPAFPHEGDAYPMIVLAICKNCMEKTGFINLISKEE